MASRMRRVDSWLGVLAMVLALATLVQGFLNRGLQKDVVEGQQQLAKAQTLANLDNSLIQLLAKSAVDNKDQALRDLLARNGVTFQARAPVASPANATATDTVE
jgi:hypothetical protein